MNRYYKVLMAQFNLSTKRYLEHRWNTFGTLVSSTLAILVTILFVEVIFTLTKEINGWNRNEVLFFTGLVRIFTSLFSFLFLRSINLIPQRVRRGDLDFDLIKPINIQFLLSFRFIRIYEVLNIIPGLVLIIYTAKSITVEDPFISALLLTFGLIIGLLILYGFYFSISVLSFWFIRLGSLPNFWSIITTPLSFPLDILGNKLSWVLTFIIPLGLMLTIPVKIYLDRISPAYLLISALFALSLLWFSSWFLNFALKRYTSASS